MLVSKYRYVPVSMCRHRGSHRAEGFARIREIGLMHAGFVDGQSVQVGRGKCRCKTPSSVLCRLRNMKHRGHREGEHLINEIAA